KDPYYLYQSEWTDRPVLHVFPHWNWAPGDTIDVWAYSNADDVELFLNAVSLSVQRKEGEVLHLMWRVPYAPGTLRAVADKGGAGDPDGRSPRVRARLGSRRHAIGFERASRASRLHGPPPAAER